MGNIFLNEDLNQRLSKSFLNFWKASFFISFVICKLTYIVVFSSLWLNHSIICDKLTQVIFTYLKYIPNEFVIEGFRMYDNNLIELEEEDSECIVYPCFQKSYDKTRMMSSF